MVVHGTDKNIIPYFRNALGLNILFGLFLLVLLTTQVIVFLKANALFVDTDQPFMWAGVTDYANGNFYEPRFYGQDYNSFFESLLAVPFYKLGMPVYYALPLATHILFLTPIIFSACYLFFKQSKIKALFFLGIFLCLTPAFHIMMSIPRGFVTGVFFCTFFILSFQNPQSMRYFLLNTLCFTVGLFLNPNILIVAGPLFLWILIHNYKRVQFYFIIAGGLVSIVLLHLFFDKFYSEYPERIIYGLIHSFHIDYMIQNITSLDQVFGHINFFQEKKCYTLLLAFFGLSIVFFRNNKTVFVIFLLFLLLVFMTFIAGKTREGSTWPFYSFSRMYLGIPITLAYFITLIHWREKNLIAAGFTLIVIFSVYKLKNLEKNIAYHTDIRHASGVNLIPLKSALEAIAYYKDKCDEHQAKQLVTSTIFWLSTFVSYGGKAVYPDFPNTQEIHEDRRYWVREGNENKVFERFMLITVKSDFDELIGETKDFQMKKLDGYGLYIISNNHLKNGDFLRMVRKLED